jgi:hypothetical protein
MACPRQHLARADLDMPLREIGGQGGEKELHAFDGADDGVLDVQETTLRHGLDRDASIDVTA